jgi:hypothetical protein
MYKARPQIPNPVNTGDPITAHLLNQYGAMAGYFEGLPVDPTIAQVPIQQGRPVLMKISAATWGSGGNALDNVDGVVVTLKCAFVNPGGTSGADPVGYLNLAETNEDVVFPGVCIDGGTFEVGQNVLAVPFNTYAGLVFFFSRGGGMTRRMARISATSLIAGQTLAWEYTLQPSITANTWPWLVDDEDADPITGYNPNEMINPVDVDAGGMTGPGVTVSSEEPTCTMKPMQGFVEYWPIVLPDASVKYLFTPMPNTFSNV